MIDEVRLSRFTKQLIQYLDYNTALKEAFVLTLNYQIWLLKLNGSDSLKYRICLNQQLVTSMEFTEVAMRMYLK